MHPVRLQIGDMAALLQKEDVAGDFRSCVLLKGVVRQADGPDEVGALGQILKSPKGTLPTAASKKLSGICTFSKPFTEMLAFW